MSVTETTFVEKAEASGNPVQYVIDNWGDDDWKMASPTSLLLLIFKILGDEPEKTKRKDQYGF